MADFKTRNLLYFVAPKDLKIPVVEIKKGVTAIPGGYKVSLSCDKLVKNLWLSSTLKGEFSKNYFDLLPGETVDVEFKTSVKNSKVASLIIAKSLIDTY